MNANAELLNYVYQNSQMGVDTLSRFLEMTEDVSFREVLKKQMEGYWRFHKRAGDMLNDNGFDEKGLNAMEKIRTYLMINGSTMGIIEAQKQLHRYENEVEKDIYHFMEELQKFEEKNVEKLKEYL